MWRKLDAEEEILDLRAGLCLALPAGSRFQFRSLGDEPLSALGLTMPRWPAPDEALDVEGPLDWRLSDSGIRAKGLGSGQNSFCQTAYRRLVVAGKRLESGWKVACHYRGLT